MSFQFTGPPSGEPVSTVIVVVISIISSLFRIFTGGISRAIKRAIEGVRNGTVGLGNELVRATMKSAHALLSIVRLVAGLWERILHPLLLHVENLTRRLERIFDRVLRPYLELLERYRAAILTIYNRIVRPVLVWIQTARRMLAILRIMRVPFARRLDARLLRLEGKILAPIAAALHKINELAYYQNILLSARMILQRPLWLATLWAYQGAAVKFWWTSQSRRTDPADLARLEGEARFRTLGENVRAMEDLLAAGAGPLALPVARAQGRLGAILFGPGA